MSMCPTRRAFRRLFGQADPEDEKWERLLAVLDRKSELLEAAIDETEERYERRDNRRPR